MHLYHINYSKNWSHYLKGLTQVKHATRMIDWLKLKTFGRVETGKSWAKLSWVIFKFHFKLFTFYLYVCDGFHEISLEYSYMLLVSSNPTLRMSLDNIYLTWRSLTGLFAPTMCLESALFITSFWCYYKNFMKLFLYQNSDMNPWFQAMFIFGSRISFLLLSLRWSSVLLCQILATNVGLQIWI